MKYSVVIRPEAEADLQNTFEWYEEQEKGLGLEEHRIVVLAVLHVRRHPIRWKKRTQ